MAYRLYTVHERAAPVGIDPDVVLVREGFSWPAAILGPLWLLAHRLWLATAIYLAIALVGAGVVEILDLGEAVLPVLALGLAALTGYLGPDLWRWKLGRHGYGFTDLVGGRDRTEAESRLFGGWTPGHRAAFTPAARLGPF